MPTVPSQSEHSSVLPGPPGLSAETLAAERAVLGAILNDNSVLGATLEILTPDDFGRQAHRQIYHAMLTLSQRGDPIDPVTLSHYLLSINTPGFNGKPDWFESVKEEGMHPDRIQAYCQIVRDRSLVRQLTKLSTDISLAGATGAVEGKQLLDQLEQELSTIRVRQTPHGIKKLETAMEEGLHLLSQQTLTHDTVTGIPTGFPSLDQLTSGLQNTDLIVVAARPSMGKTNFALALARAATLLAGKAVAFFSLEMSTRQLILRLLSAEGHVNSHHLRSGHLSDQEWERIREAATRLSPANLYIDDSSNLTLQQIRGKALQMKGKTGLDLLIVDYLQLIHATGRVTSREQAISDISRGLKQLAKELNVPIVALSQLNRGVENRRPPIPMLADLRESGAIEQDSDVVIFIYREEIYDPQTTRRGIADLLIRKHRNGPLGDVSALFRNEWNSFEPDFTNELL